MPLIDIAATANSKSGAIALTRRAASALQTYLAVRQTENNVVSRDRVLLQVVTQPDKAQLIRARPMTRAIVAFLGVLFAAVALAFILENLRPRARRSENAEPLASDAGRRAA